MNGGTIWRVLGRMGCMGRSTYELMSSVVGLVVLRGLPRLASDVVHNVDLRPVPVLVAVSAGWDELNRVMHPGICTHNASWLRAGRWRHAPPLQPVVLARDRQPSSLPPLIDKIRREEPLIGAIVGCHAASERMQQVRHCFAVRHRADYSCVWSACVTADTAIRGS